MPRTQLSPSPANRSRHGFTLVEILVVISIILILSGIVIGVAGGVEGKKARSQAEGELQAIGAALESYKLQYGDYPWVSDEQDLFDHLTGRVKMVPSGDERPNMVEVDEAQRRPFLSESNFYVVDDRFVDPWGLPYEYDYRTSRNDDWRRAGFIVYSHGPDGASAAEPTNGLIPQDYFEQDENIDNIVYGYEF